MTLINAGNCQAHELVKLSPCMCRCVGTLAASLAGEMAGICEVSYLRCILLVIF